MATNNKKEVETAIGKIAAALEDLTQRYPDWERFLDRYAETPDEGFSEGMEPAGKAFRKFFSEACAEIKHGNVTEAEFLKLFPQRSHSAVQELTEPYLRVFHAFAPLRTVYEESPSKAENLIDQIWQQYVIRFNPRRKIERPSGMTDDDMSNLESVLNAFAEYCVVRMLHHDAIIYRIKSETSLPDGLCAYIARKIDKDHLDLRLNYIVSQLERLGPQEDESDE